MRQSILVPIEQTKTCGPSTEGIPRLLVLGLVKNDQADKGD
jgi:hypothetical protein